MNNYVTFSEATLKSTIAKIHSEIPEVLLIFKMPWGAWQIPLDFPDFPWEDHFPKFARVCGNPD